MRAGDFSLERYGGKSLGAMILLDKAKLYSELIPAIKQFCPKVAVLKNHETLDERPEPVFKFTNKSNKRSSLVSCQERPSSLLAGQLLIERAFRQLDLND